MHIKCMLCFCTTIFMGVASSNVTTLHVGVLLEITRYWGSGQTRTFDDVFEYVFDQINQRSDILPGFKFQLHVRDTYGHNGQAAKKLMSLINDGIPKVAILGPTKSGSLALTGQITPVYNIVQLSYLATTAETVNKTIFSTMIKVNQAHDLLTNLRLGMMKYFNWKSCGAIYHQHEISVSHVEDFMNRLPKNNFTLTASSIFTNVANLKTIVAGFKKFDVRIIMISAHGMYAAPLFCEAYKQGMYGPRYVWIFSGTFYTQGWMRRKIKTRCKPEEVQEAAQGHFTVHNLQMSMTDDTTITGKTAKDEVADVSAMLRKKTNTRFPSPNLPWVIDTAWSLALGLNNSVKILEAKGLSLHNYTNNKDVLDGIIKGILNTSFIGTSGPLSFDADGNRLGYTYLKQHFVEKSILLAFYNVGEDYFRWLVDPLSLWKDGVVPVDKAIVYNRVVKTDMLWIVIVSVLNCLGILLAVGLLGFNLYYKNHWTIMMSSPMLNYGILAGCVLMYMQVFVYVANGIVPSRQYCMMRIWLVALGFSLLFGSLFAKTYRIYVIVRGKGAVTKFMKDWQLYTRIGIMVLIDLLILVPWSFWYPMESKIHKDIIKIADDPDQVYADVYFFCYNETEKYWISILFVYKGLLLAFGVFLSWETRRVPIQELTDSKFVGACIYNIVIVCMFSVPISQFLAIEQKALKFLLESLLTVFCTTACQCIIFIPKILNRNKVKINIAGVETNTSVQKDDISSYSSKLLSISLTKAFAPKKTHPDPSSKANKTDAESLTEEKTRLDAAVSKLQVENASLRKNLKMEEVAIEHLKHRILEVTGNIHFYKSGDEYVITQRSPSETKAKVPCLVEREIEDDDEW